MRLHVYGADVDANLLDAMAMAERYPEHRGLVMVGADIKTFDMSLQWFVACTAGVKSSNRQLRRITLRDGGAVFFRRPDQAYALLGFEFAWAYFDAEPAPDVLARVRVPLQRAVHWAMAVKR